MLIQQNLPVIIVHCFRPFTDFFVLSGNAVLYNGWILYMSVFNEKGKYRRQTKAVAEPKISLSLNCG